MGTFLEMGIGATRFNESCSGIESCSTPYNLDEAIIKYLHMVTETWQLHASKRSRSHLQSFDPSKYVLIFS
mgnify:FL=1